MFYKIKYLVFVFLISTILYSQTFSNDNNIKVDFKLFNSAYAYNGENTQWEHTRTTLTYFENFTEGVFDINFPSVKAVRQNAQKCGVVVCAKSRMRQTRPAQRLAKSAIISPKKSEIFYIHIHLIGNDISEHNYSLATSPSFL